MILTIERGILKIHLFSEKRAMMFSKLKKNKLCFKSELFEIKWYPNTRSCVHSVGKRAKPQQMPPLMVRKAQWRR
ncbi:MAG: hypothetical protein ACYSRQ_01130 [Planctomycetota bacterium]